MQWYLRTSKMTSVVAIIAMPSYPTMKHKSNSNKWLTGEKKSLKKVFSRNAANPRKLQRSSVISAMFYSNFTEIYFCMDAPPENCHIFPKLLYIRKRTCKTTSDNEMHAIFYYELKKSRFKSKTQITLK